MQPELKPCPFCGETPDVEGEHTFQSWDGGKWGGVVCCCRGPEVRTGYREPDEWGMDAIEAWNERALPRAPAEDAPAYVCHQCGARGTVTTVGDLDLCPTCASHPLAHSVEHMTRENLGLAPAEDAPAQPAIDVGEVRRVLTLARDNAAQDVQVSGATGLDGTPWANVVQECDDLLSRLTAQPAIEVGNGFAVRAEQVLTSIPEKHEDEPGWLRFSRIVLTGLVADLRTVTTQPVPGGVGAREVVRLLNAQRADSDAYCPACSRKGHDGHDDGCEVARVLAGAGPGVVDAGEVREVLEFYARGVRFDEIGTPYFDTPDADGYGAYGARARALLSRLPAPSDAKADEGGE